MQRKIVFSLFRFFPFVSSSFLSFFIRKGDDDEWTSRRRLHLIGLSGLSGHSAVNQFRYVSDRPADCGSCTLTVMMASLAILFPFLFLYVGGRMEAFERRIDIRGTCTNRPLVHPVVVDMLFSPT